MNTLDAFSTSRLRETGEYLREKIPLTRAMGVRVESFAEGRLLLTSPIDANHNHLGTAFGGSLSALAVLAGYAMLWLLLEDRDCHIVVRESSMRYRRPVTGTLRALCQMPDSQIFEAFRTKFQQTGRAAIDLSVSIEEADRVCVEFQGGYVAIKTPAGEPTP